MRVRKIAATRRISESGEISLDLPEIKEFCRQHKGKAVIVRIELLPTPASEKSLAYYWGVVVPTIQRGLYELGNDLTQRETDEFIRSQMPVCSDERLVNGKLHKRVRTIDELDAAEFNEMIEQLKVWAAENLQVYVEEPEMI